MTWPHDLHMYVTFQIISALTKFVLFSIIKSLILIPIFIIQSCGFFVHVVQGKTESVFLYVEIFGCQQHGLSPHSIISICRNVQNSQVRHKTQDKSRSKYIREGWLLFVLTGSLPMHLLLFQENQWNLWKFSSKTIMGDGWIISKVAKVHYKI